MKKTVMTLIGVIAAVVGLHAFKAYHSSAVTGRMDTDPGLSRIVARKGSETIRTSLSPDGSFRLNLSPGLWQLELEKISKSRKPLNIFLDSMIIKEPGDIDLGDITPGM
ncbi:MAG: hypothetical protein ABW174_06520 [Flavitalea sp.]